jgi:hypothetical protein
LKKIKNKMSEIQTDEICKSASTEDIDAVFNGTENHAEENNYKKRTCSYNNEYKILKSSTLMNIHDFYKKKEEQKY